MHVVVIESPTKAKTIQHYLGGDCRVLATWGHVRDLPAKDGSVRPDSGFAMTYASGPRARRVMGRIRTALKGADSLILATDLLHSTTVSAAASTFVMASMRSAMLCAGSRSCSTVQSAA